MEVSIYGVAIIGISLLAVGVVIGTQLEESHWRSRAWVRDEAGGYTRTGSTCSGGQFYYVIPERGFDAEFVRRKAHDARVDALNRQLNDTRGALADAGSGEESAIERVNQLEEFVGLVIEMASRLGARTGTGK